MKKINLFVFVLLFIFTSCEKEAIEDDLQSVENDVQISPFVPSQSVNLFAKSVSNGWKQEKGVSRDIKSIEAFVSQTNDTLMYVVNYGDSKGWLVVSADKRTPALLSYSEKGNFDLQNPNPGDMVLLTDNADAIASLKDKKIDKDSYSYKLWTDIETQRISGRRMPGPGEITEGYWKRVNLGTTTTISSTKKVGPLLKTTWHQRAPLNHHVPRDMRQTAVNNLHPRCAVGCVAVATSQVMYYLQDKYNRNAPIPTKGSCEGLVWKNGHSVRRTFESPSNSAWDKMNLTGRSYGSGSIDQTSLLLGLIGSELGTSYGESSSAKSGNILEVFHKHNFTGGNRESFNNNKAISELDAGRPVLVDAARTKIHHGWGPWKKTIYKNGHQWVMDGYDKITTMYTSRYTWEWISDDGREPLVERSRPDFLPPWINADRPEDGQSSFYRSNTYVLMNWGWGSSSENHRYLTTSEWKVGKRNYQYRKNMIINIK